MAVSLPLAEEYEKKEKCGLFGVWGTSEAAHIVYQGLFAQQHRGQESAGIVVSDGIGLHGHTGMGLVSQVFTPRMLARGTGRQCRHRSCALFDDGVKQTVQRPAAAPAIFDGPRGGGS